MSLALSCQEVTEDDVLDASCLLEVLRMYRWQISSFEEQVITAFNLDCPIHTSVLGYGITENRSCGTNSPECQR